jgi:ketosteroid isomerase-like protein
MKTMSLLAALAALLPCCVRADSGAHDYASELIAADTAFCAESAKAGVLQAFLSVATPDTKLLSETGKGFEAVSAAFKSVPPTATLSWKPSFAAASAAGDLGYTWGRYEYRDKAADGRPIVQTGTYVTVWRRQADGSWKVVLDGGTTDPKAK